METRNDRHRKLNLSIFEKASEEWTEEELNKAIEGDDFAVFDKADLDAFISDLEKSGTDEDIEKAGKDFGKLVKRQVQITRNGKRITKTVWVKPYTDDEKKQVKSKGKDGVSGSSDGGHTKAEDVPARDGNRATKMTNYIKGSGEITEEGKDRFKQLGFSSDQVKSMNYDRQLSVLEEGVKLGAKLKVGGLEIEKKPDGKYEFTNEEALKGKIKDYIKESVNSGGIVTTADTMNRASGLPIMSGDWKHRVNSRQWSTVWSKAEKELVKDGTIVKMTNKDKEAYKDPSWDEGARLNKRGAFYMKSPDASGEEGEWGNLDASKMSVEDMHKKYEELFFDFPDQADKTDRNKISKDMNAITKEMYEKYPALSRFDQNNSEHYGMDLASVAKGRNENADYKYTVWNYDGKKEYGEMPMDEKMYEGLKQFISDKNKALKSK